MNLKTRNVHWNIEGSDFHPMHKFFEEQFDDIIDDVAERIRALATALISLYSPIEFLVGSVETKYFNT